MAIHSRLHSPVANVIVMSASRKNSSCSCPGRGHDISSGTLLMFSSFVVCIDKCTRIIVRTALSDQCDVLSSYFHLFRL
ncbi:hypothetical protein KC19_9G138300 [Ceratodon purpureus]|uniref:Uncharacterized protein n=2 Tax=Ceratodon purpureus TaxID=3225 RepID=A0A8T0GUV0_CERPU|nr:hypothetical protein KC19_9G138300 [Ceratodon purpureus]